MSIEQYPTLLRGLRSCSEGEQISLLRHLCRTDLYFLLWYALNRADVEHEWLYERCKEVQESPNGHLDLWAREHYKSTIITFAKTIQDILASHGDHPLESWGGREPTFGIFSHTRPNAKGFLKQIKIELESNELLKSLFPDVLYQDPKKQSPKWSEDEGLIVKRRSNPKEATVEAWGLVDSQPTGKHFVVLIYDDVVTEASVTTKEMLDKTTRSWELSTNLGSDGGVKRYIGTRYHDLDTYSVMLERGSAKPRIYPATDTGKPDGKPVFMSESYLASKRTDQGPHVFSCQMLLDPIPEGNAMFQRDWFRRHDIRPINVRAFGASDYAVTDGGGDWTEHGVFGIDHKGNIYVLDWWSGQTTSDIWIETQIDLMSVYDPEAWVGESGPIRSATEPFLRMRMRDRGTFSLLEWYSVSADKPTRARNFQAIAAQGLVSIPNTEWGDALLDQLCRFPLGSADDKVDVCSLFGRHLQKVWAADAPKPKRHEDIWREPTVGELTGIY